MKFKKKYLVIILALSIGSLSIVSFAWFTKTFSIDSNLKITTGTIKFSIENESWVLEAHNRAEPIDKNFNGSKMVKEGDVFVKNITVRNTGSLKQKLIFNKNNNLPKESSYTFEMHIFVKSGTLHEKIVDEIILEPNATKDIAIVFDIKNSQPENKDKEISIDFSKLKNTDFGTFVVTQID